jgi:hypothetical protein
MEANEGLRLCTECVVVAIELLEEWATRLGVVAMVDFTLPALTLPALTLPALTLPDLSECPVLCVDPSEVIESPREWKYVRSPFSSAVVGVVVGDSSRAALKPLPKLWPLGVPNPPPPKPAPALNPEEPNPLVRPKGMLAVPKSSSSNAGQREL